MELSTISTLVILIILYLIFFNGKKCSNKGFVGEPEKSRATHVKPPFPDFQKK